MRPLPRPSKEERERWEELETTKSAKKKLQDRIHELSLNGKGPEALSSADFSSAWAEAAWAKAIAIAQDGQCGWCTVKPTDGNDTGAIDHLRPKTEVVRAVDQPGEEDPARGSVDGRTFLPEKPLKPGYHWLAYDPTNFLYACDRCNTGWKRRLWPVAPDPAPSTWAPPSQTTPETEHVLDPFSPGFDPFKHFLFGETGGIAARLGDQKAEATIAMVGLDRASLQEKRQKQIKRLRLDVRTIQRAGTTAIAECEELFRLLAEACEWRSSHAAYFRAALRRELEKQGLRWSDLRQAWDTLGLAKDVEEPPADAWLA